MRITKYNLLSPLFYTLTDPRFNLTIFFIGRFTAKLLNLPIFLAYVEIGFP